LIKIKEAAELINTAKSPFILFGQESISGKCAELKAFVEKNQNSSCLDHLWISALPTDHP
jgi:acetolactate synthase-1/2/3 large subunit